MEEIKVGEYVRTDKGSIIKITSSRDIGYLEEEYPGFKKTIIKHNKNIIDLIEIGDIVRIRTGLYSSFMEFMDNEECLLILKEQVKKFWTIEEILTKERYMANCYKVGGEDEF